MSLGVTTFARAHLISVVFFFQAEDGIRDLVRSRGLGDVYKRQDIAAGEILLRQDHVQNRRAAGGRRIDHFIVRCDLQSPRCLLYTSDAADERSSVDLGGRRIIKKKKREKINMHQRRSHYQDAETTSNTMSGENAGTEENESNVK